MKTKFLIIIAIFAGLSVWTFYPSERDATLNPKSKMEQSPAVPERVTLAKSDLHEIQPTMEEVKNMFETPVEFYGRVLDQNDQPVVGAEISCSWGYMGPMNAPRKLQSAAPDGRFEVKDLKASSISITVVAPPGYHRLPDDTGKTSKDIQIAEIPKRISLSERYRMLTPEVKASLNIAEAYKPDKNKPMIFRLKKLGKTDSLYSKDQSEFHKQFGAVRYLSLKGRSVDATIQPVDDHSVGYIFTINETEREANKRDWKSNSQWSWGFRIQVPGGGIQVVPGDHSREQPEQIFKGNEMAPESGYQAEILLDFPKTLDASQWKDRTNAGYFIRFRDGTFARVTISANEQGVSIKSYYNPTGSRNLIFDYSKRIEE